MFPAASQVQGEGNDPPDLPRAEGEVTIRAYMCLVTCIPSDRALEDESKAALEDLPTSNSSSTPGVELTETSSPTSKKDGTFETPHKEDSPKIKQEPAEDTEPIGETAESWGSSPEVVEIHPKTWLDLSLELKTLKDSMVEERNVMERQIKDLHILVHDYLAQERRAPDETIKHTHVHLHDHRPSCKHPSERVAFGKANDARMREWMEIAKTTFGAHDPQDDSEEEDEYTQAEIKAHSAPQAPPSQNRRPYAGRQNRLTTVFETNPQQEQPEPTPEEKGTILLQQAIKQNWSNLGSGKLPTGGEALQALKDLSTYMGPTKQAYELGALRSILAVFGRQERPDLYESDQQAWQKFRVTERYFRRSATALQNILRGSSTTG